MAEAQAVTPAESARVTGRPTKSLPIPQLIRISLYWLGLSSIFTGLGQIKQRHFKIRT